MENNSIQVNRSHLISAIEWNAKRADALKHFAEELRSAFPIGATVNWYVRRSGCRYPQSGTVVKHSFMDWADPSVSVKNDRTGVVQWLTAEALIEGATT